MVSEVRGTGVTYPGFNPVVSDFFLYELEPGKLALFKIDTTPNRLSIRTGTCHEIAFILDRFLDSNDIEQIKLRVSDEAWFDKQNYLNGEASLIMYDDWALIHECEKRIGILHDFYMDKFWNEGEYQSFLRPDGVYDPYLIRFYRSIFSVNDVGRLPQQYMRNLKNSQFTILEKIKAPKEVPWEILHDKCTVSVMENYMRDVYVSPLINRPYLVVDKSLDITKDDVEYYIVGDVSGIDSSGYDNFQKILCAYLNNEVINSEMLLTEESNYLYWSDIEQFYKIPIIIYLMKKVVQGIRLGVIRFTKDVSREMPVQLTFDNTLVENDSITILSVNEQKVLGIIDENNNIWRPSMGYVKYLSDSVIIDLTSIFTERNITAIAGTWKVTMSTTGSVIRDPNNP